MESVFIEGLLKLLEDVGRFFSRVRSPRTILIAPVLLLSACATTPSASTATTVAVEATFGTLKLWSITPSVDGLYSVVYLDPYWLVFNQQEPTVKWKLKMPTNVSSRRGIVLASSAAGVKAVGFIPYEAQTNTIVFEYGPSGAYQPSFFNGSLLTSNQSLAYNGSDLYALATVGSKTVIEEQNQSGGTFTSVATLPVSASGGSIGFNGNFGVAVLSTSQGDLFETTSTDGGKTWSGLVSLPSLGKVSQIFVLSIDTSSSTSSAQSGGTPSFAVVSSSGSASYTTSFFSGGAKAASISTTTPPILGTSVQGAILEVDGAIGGNLSLRTFSQGTISAASNLQGVQGAVEAISSASRATTILATANGLPTSYEANPGSNSFNSPSSFDVSALNG